MPSNSVPHANRRNEILCHCQYCGHSFLLNPEKAKSGIVNLKCPQCMAPLTIDVEKAAADTAKAAGRRRLIPAVAAAAAILLLAVIILLAHGGKPTTKVPLTGDALIESLSRYLTTDVDGVKSYTVTAENFFEFYDTDTGDCEHEPGDGEMEIYPRLWLCYRLKPELMEIIDPDKSSVKARVEGAYTLTLIQSVNWETGEIQLSSTSSSDKITGVQNVILANGQTEKATHYDGRIGETVSGAEELDVPLNYWSHGAWLFNNGIKGPIPQLTRENYIDGKTWLPQFSEHKLVSAQGSLRIMSHEELGYQVQKDDTAKIIRYTGKAENLRLPRALDGHRITAIGDSAFSGCESLKTVSIPEGVTDIDGWAFENCPNLSSVSLPGGACIPRRLCLQRMPETDDSRAARQPQHH